MKTIVLGLALAMSVAGLATGFGLPAEEPKAFFVGEDFDGNLIIEEVGIDHDAKCGGFAGIPDGVDECTTGSHVRVTGLSHGFALFPSCGEHLGLPAPPTAVGALPCYSGVATSQVAHATGARTFICSIDYLPVPARVNALLMINSVSCAGSGLFPPVGATFVHRCWSDDSGTPGAGNSGTGTGDWGCAVTAHG